MKRLIERLQPLKTAVKSVFFISIAVLVVVELIRLKRTITLESLESALSGLSIWHLALMVVIGLVAVLPMLFYDLILNKELETDYSKSYILETSWAVNTINNLSGFAGLVDVGLRYSFYSEDGHEKSGVKALSRLLPYFMSGLSLLSGLVFATFWFFPLSPDLRKYWLLLLGIFLYLPFIFFVSSREKLPYFGQVPLKTRLSLILVSTAEWGTALVSFLSVAYLMGLHVPLYNLIPLYFLAVIIGIFSMIPGGIGSFDLIVISGLTSMGVSNALAVSLLLLFRLTYYIIPFLLGVVFFFKHMGGHINDKYFNIHSRVFGGSFHLILVYLLLFLGIFLILSAIIPESLANVYFISRFDPIQEQLIWQFPSILFGTLFVFMSRLIRRRVKGAFIVSLLTFVLTLIYVNLNGTSWTMSFMIVLSMILMLLIRKRLNRHYFVYSWEDKTKDFLFLAFTILVLLVLGGSGFWSHLLPPRNRDILGHFVHIWFDILLASVIIATIVWLVLRVLAPRKHFGQSMDNERFTALLEKYGGASESALAYLHDKRLFWYRVDGQDQVVFQFAQISNKCVIMGNPIGNEKYYRPAWEAFLKNLSDWNLQALFYEADERVTLMLHDYGFDFMKFGENAMVDLTTFSVDGKHGKKFRKPTNRVEKAGFQFKLLNPPFSETQMQEMKAVSDIWLNGRKEKGFSLGFFDEAYLQQAPIAIVESKEGEIVAFANIMPTQNKRVATIDLMRYDFKKAPEGIMDYLFVKLFQYFKEEGKQYFDMGMAPLANVGTEEDSFIEEKVANLVYVFAQRFYSFSGLQRYKEKFSPIWSPKYIVYPKRTWLLFDMIAIFRIDNRKIEDKMKKRRLWK